MTNEWREQLIHRLSPGLDHHINLPAGWKLPVLKLMKQLDELLGKWTIGMIESRYGELYFYADCLIGDKVTGEQMTKYIHDAEKDCRTLCMDCGAFGELVSIKYRPLIICEDCKLLRKVEVAK